MESKGLLLIVSGPAGVGKGTIVNILTGGRREYFKSISATTRNPRPMEKEGVDYYYITREEFENKIASGDMLEHTQYNGNYYGTPLSPMKKHIEEGNNVVLEIETDGAFQVKAKFPDAVLIFICPPSFEELERRLRGRKTETEEAILKRLSTAKHELTLMPKYDYVIINEDNNSEKSAKIIEEIVNAEKHRTSRNISDIKFD